MMRNQKGILNIICTKYLQYLKMLICILKVKDAKMYSC